MYDLAHERHRLLTFDFDCWPHDFINPRKLAKSGFYYVGPYDQVQCFFCNVRIWKWEMGDNEVTEHRRWSPQCPLLERRETTNVPIKPIITQSDDVPPRPIPIDRRPGSYAETLTFSTPNDQLFDIAETITAMAMVADADAEGMNMPGFRRILEFPEYAIEMDRLQSFNEWPKSMKQKPEQLSDAGFFYTQKGDRVICFSCGGGLREWEEDDDDPWEQHALWYNFDRKLVYYLNPLKDWMLKNTLLFISFFAVTKNVIICG